MMLVAALAGESLDALIWRALGRWGDIEERRLAATPGLATIALALPAGHPVALPDLDPGPSRVDLIQLWD